MHKEIAMWPEIWTLVAVAAVFAGELMWIARA
jgi:hypothetical protein